MSTLRTEVRQLENYFAIQQIRFADRLHYTIQVEEELQTMLTPKLLQPIVENTFIHGIDHMSECGEIRIRAFCLSNMDAAISIWNNDIFGTFY
jgi:two-component system sensor histidine kinase YesM